MNYAFIPAGTSPHRFYPTILDALENATGFWKFTKSGSKVNTFRVLEKFCRKLALATGQDKGLPSEIFAWLLKGGRSNSTYFSEYEKILPRLPDFIICAYHAYLISEHHKIESVKEVIQLYRAAKIADLNAKIEDSLAQLMQN